jgi:O-methyltransferase involved in polyketide biosynthesis
LSEKIHIELGDVQKTLLLPLWGRAVETQKTTPLLIDHTATEIMKKIDYDFSEGTKHLSAISQLGWIVRSFHIDTMITQLIEKYPTSTIVNIGCGLDTTFDRIDNGQLSWYDVDLPDVIALRRKLIPEHKRRTCIASSFLSHDWLTQLTIQEKVLFIAAGVLYYFAEHQIKEFLTHLAEGFPGGEIVFDASSPVGIKMANKMVITASGMDEKSFLKWGLKRAKTLELWDRRIKIVEEYPMFRTVKNRFKLKDRIMAWFSDVFKIQYMVHVQFVKS